MRDFTNLKYEYATKGKHWYNVVIYSADEKYKIIAYARMQNITFQVSGYYDGYMIELYMDEEQRDKAYIWINTNIGGIRK